MEKKIMTGNQAAAYAANLCRIQVVSAYPITPQTSIVETLSNLWAEGEFEGEFVVVDSEYSAMSYLIGAGYAGARTFTASASHGLAYMHEVLHWAAGARLPIVMVNVNRAIGAPWCLEPDQLDSLSQRDTGWMQLYCSSVQEIADMVIMAFRLAEAVKIPCMVVLDGFALSHTYEAVELPEQEKVDAFLPLPPDRPQLVPQQPVNIQPLVFSNKMMEIIKSRHQSMTEAPRLLKQFGEDFREIFHRSVVPVEPTHMEEAETVIVAAGAMAQTIKSSIRPGNKNSAVGLMRMIMFRPFPQEEVVSYLASDKIKRVIVFDRNISAGSRGIFCQEVRAALYDAGYYKPVHEVVLAGGLDLTPEMVQRAVVSLSETDEAAKKIVWGVELQDA